MSELKLSASESTSCTRSHVADTLRVGMSASQLTIKRDMLEELPANKIANKQDVM
jgi:hypothetical protein